MNKSAIAALLLLMVGCTQPSTPPTSVAVSPAKERDIVLLTLRLRDAGVGQTIRPGENDNVMYLDNLGIFEVQSPDAARVAAVNAAPHGFAYKQFVLLGTSLDLAVLRRARAVLIAD